MIIHDAPAFRVYFGNAGDHLNPERYLALNPNTVLLEDEYFARMGKIMHLEELMFLKQTHSINGLVIDHETLSQFSPFSYEGDYLITHGLAIGLGIMTADCLPVIIIDLKHHVAGIAHAGWRGAVAGIVPKLYTHMQEQFGVEPSQLRVLFGPSARSCCYEVDPTFIDQLDHLTYTDELIQKHGDSYYFDLPSLVLHQLYELGIKKSSCITQYNLCTICDKHFCSYRRDGSQAGRQMTVVALK